MLWSGWGDPAEAAPLPGTVIALLRDLLGVKPRGAETIALEDIAVPGSPLAEEARQDLVDCVGDPVHVRTDAESRIRHTRGKSTPDLLRIRLRRRRRPSGGRRAAHAATTRSWRSSRSAPNTASPSSPSAAAPPSSADSPRRGGAPSSRWTCAA